jgi:two-component system, NarL family, nitrate/nitrite response regulator NarL
MRMRESNIVLLLRSRLVRDCLSSLLLGNELIQGNKETVVVIDFDDCDDREVIRGHQQRGVKIVVLASGAESLRMNPAQIASLSGVLTYDLSADAFVRSLRLICSGERVFPCELTQERKRPAASPPDIEPRSGGTRLSPREKEVLLDLVEGHSNKAIARHLGMTEATVKVHLKSVLRKINVENRTQAAIWALANLPELDATPRGFV